MTAILVGYGIAALVGSAAVYRTETFYVAHAGRDWVKIVLAGICWPVTAAFYCAVARAAIQQHRRG